jgi:hypothetical protein
MRETIKYAANGKEYDISVITTESGITVCTYFQGKAHGKYTASYETSNNFDAIAAQVTGVKARAQLIEIAKNHLTTA